MQKTRTPLARHRYAVRLFSAARWPHLISSSLLIEEVELAMNTLEAAAPIAAKPGKAACRREACLVHKRVEKRVPRHIQRLNGRRYYIDSFMPECGTDQSVMFRKR